MLKPYAHNFWKSTNGPYEEIVYSLAVNKYGHVFAGTFRSGVFRANPYGTYWTQTSLTNSYITSLAISPEKYIFAGAYEKGVFRSIDNGVSWTQTSFYNHSVNSLAINNQNVIFAGTNGDGVFYSKNNGSTWNKTGLDTGVTDALLIDPEGNIFAGTENGLYFSDTHGQKWVKKNNGLESFDINALYQDNQGRIYLGSSGSGLYYSSNMGKLWVPLFSGEIDKNVWAISGTDSGDLFVATDKGVYHISELLKISKINSGLNNHKVYSLCLNNEGYLYSGTFGWGVFKSMEPVVKMVNH